MNEKNGDTQNTSGNNSPNQIIKVVKGTINKISQIGNLININIKIIIPKSIVQFFTGDNEQRTLRTRQTILSRVRKYAAKNIPDIPIILGLKTNTESVICPRMELQKNDSNRILPQDTKIIDVFNDANKALLILGDPGAGKTTTLFDLARDKIVQVEQNFIRHIPIVFNLSSWANKKLSIEKWLVEELNTKYNISNKKIVYSWIENNDLLILLDGLDEVKAEFRNACVEAINNFRKRHGEVPIAICSRIKDYEQLSSKLNLQTAVILQPLTPEQIEQYLTNNETDLSALRNILKHNYEKQSTEKGLQELAKSPLMLNIMALVYGDKSTEDLQLIEKSKNITEDLFDSYIVKMFERRILGQQPDNKPYTDKQSINWLRWLASKLKGQDHTFLIEQIQPKWLNKGGRIWTYIISKLIFGLIVGIVVFMVIENELWARLFYSFTIGFVSGIFVMPNSIKIVEELKWSWKKAIIGTTLGLSIGLLGGLVAIVINILDFAFGDKIVVGLFGGLIIGLTIGLVNNSWRIGISIALGIMVSLGVWQFGFLLSTGQIFDKNTILACIALFGSAGGIYGGITYSESEIKDKIIPNQGIQKSIKNALLVGATTGMFFGIIYGLFSQFVGLKTNDYSGIILGGSVGAILGVLFFGGTVVILHFSIRYFL